MQNGIPTEKEVRANVLESTRKLLDKGYITAKGAIFFALLSLRELGVEEIHPEEMIRALGMSRSTFYRNKREIEEKEGWGLRARREIQLHNVTPPRD
jgi:hypothetical protein